MGGPLKLSPLNTARENAAQRIAVAAVAVCSLALATTAAAAPSASGATKDAAIAKQVPAAIAAKGTLNVAADASYAPNEYFDADGKTVIGMDADLAKAIATVMGLKANVKNAGFDSIIPGLAAKKYDLGMSSFTDTKEREKVVDFVTYFAAGTLFYVQAKGGPAISGLGDLCGHTVGAERGTTQATDVAAQDKACKTAKKSGVALSVFPDQNGANLALSSGRVEIVMADTPVAVYAVQKSKAKFKITGKPYGTSPYGIAIPKNSGMVKPTLAAVKKLIANGTYGKILTKWGLKSGAIKNPVVNGAKS